MNNRVLLIIPAYNEQDSILNTYMQVLEYNKKSKIKYDVIVINDCSKDETLKICTDNKIPVIDLVHNLGIGGAVQTGYKYALRNKYDIAVQFDGDGQHDVKYVENIIQPILEDEADFVIGSRFVDKSLDTFKSSKARRVGIKIISDSICFVTKKRIYDTTSGFRAANRQVIEEFSKSYPSEYPEPITNAELVKRKYRIEEVPAEMNERFAGSSSIHTWKNIYYMVNILLSVFLIGIRRYKR